MHHAFVQSHRALITRPTERPPAWTLAELCDRLSEEHLEVLSASRDSHSGAVCLEVIAAEAVAPAAVVRARRIVETAMRQPRGTSAVSVGAISPERAFV